MSSMCIATIFLLSGNSRARCEHNFVYGLNYYKKFIALSDIIISEPFQWNIYVYLFRANSIVPTQDCAVCRLIRVYLLIAVPMIGLVWLNPDSSSEFLSEVSLTNLFANLIGIVLVIMVAWKAYNEFLKR